MSGSTSSGGGGGCGSSTSDRISVAVRVRPAKSVSDPVEWIVQDNVIYGAQPENQNTVFAFDHIFSQETTNADIYEEVVGPIIDSVLDGYHGTVFAYGQTSSGKTHTMMGNDADPGVIKRAITYIFEKIHKDADREFMIRISYLEIYNEQIRDLLNPATQSSLLQIKGPDMAVSGLVEQVCCDADELIKWMLAGDKNRQVGCTNMNERSSRSHSIFRVTLESSHRNEEKHKREGVTISQLNLVDLAGSERATQTGATGTRLREGCHINTSLTALGIVIRKLSQQEKHINFRDSKLTRILQNSLGGNSRTAIVCTISPFDYETSLSTLRFGSDAKRIRNKPVINQVLSEDASLLQKRNKEIESLKTLIYKVKAGKEQELKEKDDTITQLQKKIEDLQRLAICGDLPSSVTERTTCMPARGDFRRRETWCPGQLAAATPGKNLVAGASIMFDQRNASGGWAEDSFLAQYGTYDDTKNDLGAFCTPARPRKRKSFEIDRPRVPSSKETMKTSIDKSDSHKSEAIEDIAALRGKYEDAMEELRELREHVAFLEAEQNLCCQPTAKRPRIILPDASAPQESSDFSVKSEEGNGCPNMVSLSCEYNQQVAVTPTPIVGLSLIQEEGSELEGESPFERKLKLMATPRQAITHMKRENAMLKRSLMAISGCTSPSETTGTTLRNASGPLFPRSPSPRIDTCDVGCQYEDEEVANDGTGGNSPSSKPLTEADQLATDHADAPQQFVDRATSPILVTPMKVEFPIRSTPRRRDTCDSLINFSTPQTGGSRVAGHFQGSAVSWLDTERTPMSLPIEFKDISTQTDSDAIEASSQSCVANVSIMTELSHRETRDASTSVDVDLLMEDRKPQTLEAAVNTEAETKPILVDANVSAIVFPVDKTDTGCQHEGDVVNTADMGVQCVVELTDANTSAIEFPPTVDAASQRNEETKVARKASRRATKFLFATRCMDNPASADSTSSGLLAGMNVLLDRAENPERSARTDPSGGREAGATGGHRSAPTTITTRDVGCQARIEELWVVRMKLEKERAAREDTEERCDDLWREKSRLMKTNDKYLAFLKQSGVDPKKVLSGEATAKPLQDSRNIAAAVATSSPAATSTPSSADQYREKYEAIKEFCWRHPDIKERLLSERVVLKQPKVPRTPQMPDPGQGSSAGSSTGGDAPDNAKQAQEDRPLADLKEVQEFRGVDYLAKADPAECRPS